MQSTSLSVRVSHCVDIDASIIYRAHTTSWLIHLRSVLGAGLRTPRSGFTPQDDSLISDAHRQRAGRAYTRPCSVCLSNVFVISQLATLDVAGSLRVLSVGEFISGRMLVYIAIAVLPRLEHIARLG